MRNKLERRIRHLTPKQTRVQDKVRGVLSKRKRRSMQDSLIKSAGNKFWKEIDVGNRRLYIEVKTEKE